MNADLNPLKTRIIEASLPYVAEEGWCFSALIRGGELINVTPSEVKIAFEGQEKVALKHFSIWVDQQMLQAMKAHPEFDTMKVHQKVRFGVIARLQFLNSYKKVAQKTAEFLRQPTYATLGPKLIYNTVNEVWYGVGDTSTGYNFYTKRVILSSVYGSTLLYWLKTDSEDLGSTIEFLDKRLKDSAKIPKLKEEICRGVSMVMGPIKSLFNKGPKKSSYQEKNKNYTAHQ